MNSNPEFVPERYSRYLDAAYSRLLEVGSQRPEGWILLRDAQYVAGFLLSAEDRSAAYDIWATRQWKSIAQKLADGVIFGGRYLVKELLQAGRLVTRRHGGIEVRPRQDLQRHA